MVNPSCYIRLRLDATHPTVPETELIPETQQNEYNIGLRPGTTSTGLCPYNPNIVLQSSQINAQLSTPPPTEALEDASVLIFSTPQSSQALYKAQQQLLLSESLSQSTQIVLSKAGKAIAKANTRAAKLQARNKQLKYQLDACRITRTRKRV